MVSIKDVAKHANVAVSTVSKVLNHYPNISEETRKKVFSSIEELHYIPNSIAAALSSKQFGRVALLINIDSNKKAIDEISMQYLSGALNRAMELKFDIVTIFFSMIAEFSTEEIIRYFQSQSISGIIIYGMSKEDTFLHELIQSQIFKIVVVDAPIVNKNTTAIYIDHAKAQYDVAKKTITEDNCKRVLYIKGKENGYVTDMRLEGMKQLVNDLHLSMLVRCGNFSELQARNIAFKYAKKKDVVVCASDLMAIGAMNALTEMDIFRPVCGFDGIMLMGYVGKQMNTIDQNFYSISQNAVDELQLLIKGEVGRKRILSYEIVKMYYKDIIV